jgi:hypothetical protein
MNDIVTRLRNWRNVHLARLHLLMEEAADEMERLSANGDCPVADNAANGDNTHAANDTPSEGREQSGCTLTAEEREAVAWAARRLSDDPMLPQDRSAADTLRNLLEKHKGGER